LTRGFPAFSCESALRKSIFSQGKSRHKIFATELSEDTEKVKFLKRSLVLFPARLARGFTFLELMLVLAIIGISFGLVASRSTSFERWREENAIRELVESLSFLFHQAVADRAYYRMEFQFGEGPELDSYRIGVMRPEDGVENSLQTLAGDAGNLTLELASFLSPSIGDEETMIPPPNFPSLAEKQLLPEGLRLVDVVLEDGKKTEGSPYVDFSPRGSSDFAVLHLKRSSGRNLTILINPFTGIVKVYDDYQDFEWTFGKKAAS
jgi:prepilin-type N-terminal cleavage/methylation domain-containing protein